MVDMARVSWGIGRVLALVVVTGCSSQSAVTRTVTVPTASGASAELLNGARYECPPLARAANANLADDRRQVFSELYLMEGPSATVSAIRLSDLERLAGDPSLLLLAAPHLVSDLDERIEQTLVDHIGVSQEASLHRLALMPRESSDGSVVIELGVTLQLPNATGVVPAPTATTAMTLTGAEQQLMLGSSALPHRKDRALLALVKYWRIRDSQDLRRIFECKMRQRQHALSKE
jgi:hypothetical protein